MKRLSKSTSLRRLVLPILKQVGNRNISIRHHYTGDKILLHLYKHKGYWFHGRNREKKTIEIYKRIISEGDIVFDIGGHIGYMTLLFRQMAGENGQVYVFEPGPNNLPYIEKNIVNYSNIKLIKKAISNKTGKSTFNIENITGQNNSLIGQYDIFKMNQERSFSGESYEEIEVETVKLDDFFESEGLEANFIKIDIEGAEILALEGMNSVLDHIEPMMMIEITREKERVFKLLESKNYVCYNDDLQHVEVSDALSFNTFCFKINNSYHQHILSTMSALSLNQNI